MKEEFEFVPCKSPVILGNLVGPAGVEFEPVMTREITYVNEGYLCVENCRSSLYISGHSNTGRRKINREEDMLKHFYIVAT